MKKILMRFLKRLGAFLHALFSIGIPLRAALIACLVIGGGAAGLTYSKVIRNVGGKADYTEAMRYIEIKDVLEENYIDTADRGKMGNAAAAAMVQGLGDRWSYFLSAEEYKAYQLSAGSEYSGIGMSIMKDGGSGFKITSVNPGSVAAQSGLGVGMVITGVDGQDVRSMDADAVRTLIRGKMNSEFTLTLAGADAPLKLDCTKTYVSSVTYRKEKTDAGYVQIRNFEAGTGQDAVDAVEDLLKQGIIALVIDLRGNAGGLESEIQTFMDYLLPGGVLYYTADRHGNEQSVESDRTCISLPMVVLINGETYAEAEVMAATMQELQWATLFGEATKGSTRQQETLELSDGSAIRLSTRSYLTPNRVDISAKGGVVPDMIVYNSDPSTVGTTLGTTGGEQGTASTSNDEQLMAALTYLSKNS